MAETVKDFPILLVDDDETVRKALVRVLSQSGYEAVPVLTAAQALGELRQRHYSLVIADNALPDRDAVSLLKALKHIQPDVEVIFITPYGHLSTAVEAMKAGAADYLIRPFAHADFMARIRRTHELVVLRRESRTRKRIKEAEAEAEGTPAQPSVSLAFGIGTPLADIEDRIIGAVLEHTRGNRYAAARLLHINARTICRHLGPKQGIAERESLRAKA